MSGAFWGGFAGGAAGGIAQGFQTAQEQEQRKQQQGLEMTRALFEAIKPGQDPAITEYMLNMLGQSAKVSDTPQFKGFVKAIKASDERTRAATLNVVAGMLNGKNPAELGPAIGEIFRTPEAAMEAVNKLLSGAQDQQKMQLNLESAARDEARLAFEGQRVGMEGQRIGMEGERLDLAQAQFAAEPGPDNFRPATPQEKSDLGFTDPNAPIQINTATGQASLIGAASSAESFTKSQAGNIRQSFAGASQFAKVSERLIEVVQTQGSAILGTPGGVTNFLTNTAATFSGLADIAEQIADDNDVVLEASRDVADYTSVFDSLEGLAGTSGAVKAALLDLAYMHALSRESGGKTLSDQDVERSLKQVGANVTDPKVFAQVLASTTNRVIEGVGITADMMGMARPEISFKFTDLDPLLGGAEETQPTAIPGGATPDDVQAFIVGSPTADDFARLQSENPALFEAVTKAILESP